MNNGAQLIGFLFAFLIFVPWGSYKLINKHRGAGYYILLIIWPLVGFIVACCLKDRNPEKQLPPQNGQDNPGMPPINAPSATTL